MYRSRPTEKLKDDVLKFLSSMDQDHSILYYDITGSEAHSIMLHEKGHITHGELKKILSALEEAKKNPTSIRTEEYEDIHEICAALSNLIQGLVERAKENKQVPMLMYTHLQQAQIGTFSHFLLSYAYGLMRDMERLYLTYHRINQSPLGACAIGGSSIPIDRKRTAMLLGFDSIIKNSIDATSSRDAFLEYASTLAILTSTLGRIAEDFIIW